MGLQIGPFKGKQLQVVTLADALEGMTWVLRPRTPLAPLRLLYHRVGGQEGQYEEVGSLANILVGWRPPSVEPVETADTLLTLNKSSIAIDASSILKMASGGASGGLASPLQGDVSFVLRLREPSDEMVDFNLLDSRLTDACLTEPALKQLQDGTTEAYVVTRSLKAKSLTCYARRSGSKRARLWGAPSEAHMDAELSITTQRDRITFFETSGQPLVFAIKMHSLRVEDKQIFVETLGSPPIKIPAARPSGGMMGGLSVSSGRYEQVRRLRLHEEVVVKSEFLDINRLVVAT